MADRNETSLKAFIALKRTNDAIDIAIRKDIRKYGLSVTEFAVLEVLNTKGPLTIQTIRDRILIASSSTTYVIERLIDKGYVIKKQDTKDRRTYYASITDEGREVMENIFPMHAAMIQSFFDCLEEDELEILKEALKKVSARVSNII